MGLNSFYNNKVVLITGSSMGIGKEIALQVLLNGGKVVITGIDKDRLESTKKELNSWKNKVLCFRGDASNNNDNIEMMELIIERFGRLDILISNAGLSCYGEVEKMDWNVAKQIIDTNIYGSLFPVMAAIPQLKKAEGSIIFISSVAAFSGLPGYSAYSLSKMALKALAQSLSIELSRSKVSISISYVGFTENEDNKRTLSPNGEWINVPARAKLLTASRSTTATKILRQIKSKKFSQTNSILGIVTKFITKYFPGLTLLIFKLNYNRKNI